MHRAEIHFWSPFGVTETDTATVIHLFHSAPPRQIRLPLGKCCEVKDTYTLILDCPVTVLESCIIIHLPGRLHRLENVDIRCLVLYFRQPPDQVDYSA